MAWAGVAAGVSAPGRIVAPDAAAAAGPQIAAAAGVHVAAVIGDVAVA